MGSNRYKRLWDKAREQRPGIHSRPAEPLIEKYISYDGYLDQNAFGGISKDGYMEFCVFGELFRGFSFRRASGSTSGIYALHADASKLFRKGGRWPGNEGAMVRSRDDGTFQLCEALAVATLVRSLCLREGMAPADATEAALISTESLMADPSNWPVPPSLGIERDCRQAAAKAVNSMARYGSLHRWGCDRMEKKLACSLGVLGTRPSMEAETDIRLPAGQLARLMHDMRGFMPERAFSQPAFTTRLVAVLGKEYLFAGGSPLAERGITDIFNDIDAGRGLLAAVIIYPWEADFLAKAKVIGARGVPVARPAGVVFAGEIELAVSEWVGGDRLDMIPDLQAWRCFGRTLRKCHERGVSPRDASGRNAIWTGKQVKLIDFEDTVISRDARPIPQHEQEGSFGRVMDELQDRNDPALMRAFEDGYRG